MTDAEKYRLSQLCPPLRARAEGIIQRMIQRGFREPFVGSTLRSPAQQADAVERGTTGRKQILTWHYKFTLNGGGVGARALDFRDRLPNGKQDPTTRNELFFLALWEEATMAGLRCLGYVRDKGGHPQKFFINGGKVWDPGHCEWREPYKSLVEAVTAEAPHLLDIEAPPDPDDDEAGSRDRALGLAPYTGLPPSPF